MLRSLSLIIILIYPCLGFAQLSKGEGEMITLPGNAIRCYLPKHFKVQTQPLGVIHKESGAFVILAKMPPEKRVSIEKGLERSFFEDTRYTIMSLNDGNLPSLRRHQNRRLYTMVYTISGYEFERQTMLLNAGQEQYLVIGNYPTKLKPQVIAEVEKIMANFIIR